MKLHSNRIYTPKGPKAGVLTVEGGKITAFAENTTDPEAIEYGDQRIIPGILILITTAPAVMISRIRMPPMKSRSHP